MSHHVDGSWTRVFTIAAVRYPNAFKLSAETQAKVDAFRLRERQKLADQSLVLVKRQLASYVNKS
jgi:hypothetical protein